jgi:hypothetical protein
MGTEEMGGPYVVLDWRALAGKRATEEGPQEGI